MKIVVRLLIALVLLLVVVAFVGFLMIDSIVEGVVEKGGTYATGVAVTLDKADVSLGSGRIGLAGFAIANPPGFRNEPFVSATGATAAWQNGSVFSDRLVIDELTLDGVALNLERNDAGTNFGKIIDHLQTLAPDKKPAEPKSDDGAKKALVVKHIQIRDVKAAVHLGGIATGSAGVHVPLIEIKDFESDGTTSENVGRLTSAIVNAILSSTLDAGSADLPKEILSDLKGNLDGLKKQAKDLLKDLDIKNPFKKK